DDRVFRGHDAGGGRGKLCCPRGCFVARKEQGLMGRLDCNGGHPPSFPGYAPCRGGGERTCEPGIFLNRHRRLYLPRPSTMLATPRRRLWMKAISLAGLLAFLPLQEAQGWGQEGHSIVAEIAQRRLDADTLK